MQELSNSIKKSTLRTMVIKEGAEAQAKGTHNIFNKIIAENFPILRKSCLFMYRKAPGHKQT
jgi:hypothetical protein